MTTRIHHWQMKTTSDSDEMSSDSENQADSSSEGDLLEGEQPVSQGTSIRRRTF